MPGSGVKTAKDVKMPKKSDGTNDKRFTKPQVVKKNGTVDMRCIKPSNRK